MTRSTMVKEQNYEQAQDSIYDHGSIDLESQYASGDGWIAFNGKLRATQESLIVKRYQGENIAERRAIHEADIKEFKKTWHPNLLQYLGRSRPGVDDPHTVLKGVTSDHVSNYIALKFAEDNQAGSIEALRLLKDLTNALAFTVGTTNSSSFDISKVHLNDSGGLVVVNLDPTLVVDKGSKDDMPQWRSWQQICVELLAGDPSYEPNPSIEYDTDPALHRRLEYLRPILGHIHYGGARFQSRSIEMAFKSEGLVLSQAFHELQTLVRRNPREPEPSDTQVLRANLHYAAHFREPLAIDVGDIGYIAGDPPQFVRLANVRTRITDGWAFEALRVQPFRCVPADKWTRTTVDGVVRHEFRFPTSGPVDLEDWRTMRPRIDKDFLLRRINVPPRDTGLVVECSEAWKVDAEQWREIWTKEGLPSPPDAIYFYEAPPGGPNGVWGYFSLSAVPGRPYQKWTPERDEDGHEWGWTFLSEIWTVEISKCVIAMPILCPRIFAEGVDRPNVKQYIRYCPLLTFPPAPVVSFYMWHCAGIQMEVLAQRSSELLATVDS
ncbi:hypothetical protein C8R46DRAFT_1106395 [Mycena filopes]|nr:hypothetical protein C8R46DRAFT_1106395 [Mycena filopes]